MVRIGPRWRTAKVAHFRPSCCPQWKRCKARLRLTIRKTHSSCVNTRGLVSGCWHKWLAAQSNPKDLSIHLSSELDIFTKPDQHGINGPFAFHSGGSSLCQIGISKQHSRPNEQPSRRQSKLGGRRNRPNRHRKGQWRRPNRPQETTDKCRRQWRTN